MIHGPIASGDQFIASEEARERLQADLPDVLAIDMESGAVAQVCYEYGIPFGVIRIISDGADDEAAVDCMRFIREIAPQSTRSLLKEIYRKGIE